MKQLRMTAFATGMLIAGACICRAGQDHKYRSRLFFGRALRRRAGKNCFRNTDWSLRFSYVQGGPLALQAVLTKQADIGILSYEHVLTVAVQGKRIVAFFNIANRP